MIVLETALPAKFNETIREALGAMRNVRPVLKTSKRLPQRFVVMPADVQAMKDYIRQHTGL
jgi:threonine synthase